MAISSAFFFSSWSMAWFFPSATAISASLVNLSLRSFCWTLLEDGAFWAMMAWISRRRLWRAPAICRLLYFILGFSLVYFPM